MIWANGRDLAGLVFYKEARYLKVMRFLALMLLCLNIYLDRLLYLLANIHSIYVGPERRNIIKMNESFKFIMLKLETYLLINNKFPKK